MRQIEVRYCDERRQLLGWARIPDASMALGQSIRVQQDQDGIDREAFVEFPVVSLRSGFGHSYLALKADGHTPEAVAWLLRAYNYNRAP